MGNHHRCKVQNSLFVNDNIQILFQICPKYKHYKYRNKYRICALNTSDSSDHREGVECAM